MLPSLERDRKPRLPDGYLRWLLSTFRFDRATRAALQAERRRREGRTPRGPAGAPDRRAG
jgi:hypothetical protein